MGTIASQITSLTIVYSTVYSGADQSKHQSSASLAFVWGIHRGPVNSPHKWPVTRKMFPFDDVIMCTNSHIFLGVNIMSQSYMLCCVLLFIMWLDIWLVWSSKILVKWSKQCYESSYVFIHDARGPFHWQGLIETLTPTQTKFMPQNQIQIPHQIDISFIQITMIPET